MEILDGLLERLTTACAVGYAGDGPQAVLRELEDAGVPAMITADRSVHATLAGPENRQVVIACHLDEVGFIVTSIDADGFARIGEVGGSDRRILIGQEVLVHGRETVHGYIGAKPPHLMSAAEKNRVFELSELFVDTGKTAEELKKSVRIGDMVTFRNRYLKLNGSQRSAKAIDNRASVAAGILAVRELRKQGAAPTVHFIATSQEEFSGLGARLMSQKIGACCAIVVDATFGDQPDMPESEVFPLESGPALGRGGSLSTKLFDLLAATAQEQAIPYQVEPLPASTGTDVDNIAFSVEGIPCCLLSIPVRNMHTPVEVVSLTDIERTAQLIVSFIKKI